MLRQKSQKLRFAGRYPSSFMLLFTQYKTTWLTAISSHCLAALPAKMSAFNSYMLQNAYYCNLKLTFEELLPCYCYTIKASSTKIYSNVSQPASASKGADMSEQQAHNCLTPEQQSGSCAV